MTEQLGTWGHTEIKEGIPPKILFVYFNIQLRTLNKISNSSPEGTIFIAEVLAYS